MFPSNTTVRTMSSREIAVLTDKQHPHVKRDIETMLSQLNHPNLEGSNITETPYIHRGNTYTEYNLPRRECEILITGYDIVRRAAVIDRWMQLEAQQFRLPQTFGEALRLAAEQQEQIEEQARLITEQAPRVEYYDRVLDTSNGFSVTHIAKELGMSARRLNKELHERGVQYKQGTQWFLYSEHQDKGWTMQSTTVFEHNGTERTSHSTLWTEAGREAILNMYNTPQQA